MTTFSKFSRIATVAALPIVSAGILGAAALGLSGVASAQIQTQVPAGPGHSYAPDTHATPARSQGPGWQAHHGPAHVSNLHQR